MPFELAPIVSVSGSRIDDEMLDNLVEVRVESEFRIPARCTLRFLDKGYANSSTAKLALGVEVAVKDAEGHVLISAEVTALELEHEGSQPMFTVVAHDRAHRLGRSSTVKTYLNQTYGDVVTKLAQKHGLQVKVTATGTPVDYLLQVESDFDLLNTLADRIGYDWWVEEKVLHFEKPASSATIDLAVYDHLDTFSVRATGDYPNEVEVKGWDRKRQQPVNGSTMTASPTVIATSAFATKVASPEKAFSSGVVVTSNVAATNAEEAKILSAALLDRMVSASVEARGSMSGNALMKPGVTVKVSDAGPASGSYQVTKVEHTYDAQSGFRTEFVAGDRRPTSLVDVLGGDAREGAFRHPGVVVGEVTNINDPLQAGRVKVRYPGLSPQEESEWARLLTVGGGKARGAVFIPEVGDEVLVAFEGGDVRQPVVLGGLYGDTSTIPKWDVTGGVVNSRRMTSRKGHYMEFGDGDSDDKQHVALVLAGEAHKLRVGKDRVDLDVPAGKPIAIKSGTNSITIDDSGKITISGQNIAIEAKQGVTIKGTTVDITAQSSLNLKGISATLKGDVTAEVNGGTATTIKGGMVMIN